MALEAIAQIKAVNALDLESLTEQLLAYAAPGAAARTLIRIHCFIAVSTCPNHNK